MTDRAWAYTRGHAFRRTRRTLGARHLVTRPYRPQTNGKAERFIETVLDEWAYAPAWVASYNAPRPHTALDGLTPMRVLCH